MFRWAYFMDSAQYDGFVALIVLESRLKWNNFCLIRGAAAHPNHQTLMPMPMYLFWIHFLCPILSLYLVISLIGLDNPAIRIWCISPHFVTKFAVWYGGRRDKSMPFSYSFNLLNIFFITLFDEYCCFLSNFYLKEVPIHPALVRYYILLDCSLNSEQEMYLSYVSTKTVFLYEEYRKSSCKEYPGGLCNFGNPRGGSLEKGGLCTLPRI